MSHKLFLTIIGATIADCIAGVDHLRSMVANTPDDFKTDVTKSVGDANEHDSRRKGGGRPGTFAQIEHEGTDWAPGIEDSQEEVTLPVSRLAEIVGEANTKKVLDTIKSEAQEEVDAGPGISVIRNPTPTRPPATVRLKGKVTTPRTPPVIPAA